MKNTKRILFACFCIFGPFLILYFIIGFLCLEWDITKWTIFKKTTELQFEPFFYRVCFIFVNSLLCWFGYYLWTEYKHDVQD